MLKLYAKFWWAMQYPFWKIAPNSHAFFWVRAKYARVVSDWLETLK